MEKAKVKRYDVDLKVGLTDIQVNERKKAGLVNFDTAIPTKTKKQIIKENVVTWFNILNLVLGIAIFLVGSYKNLTFLGIIICNTIISTFQELHSKKIIDRLSVIASTKINVIRSSKKVEVGLDEIVLDDILCLNLGNQVVVDSILKEGDVEVNESFITGEIKPVEKHPGDMLLSGSFIVSGRALAQVEHIGLDNYTSKISHGAKYIKPVNSQIMHSLNKIIKTISFAIVPIGVLLFARQMTLQDATIQDSVVNTVAALIGMIPEGLVLLTSTVLAVSVMRLAKKECLVQELYCIETLARVDVICLDKTGTITEGCMEVEKVVAVEDSEEDIGVIVGSICQALDDNNPTSLALRQKFTDYSSWAVEKLYHFSSQNKFSGVTFAKKGTYLIGAPDFLLPKDKKYQKELQKYMSEYRVVALIHTFDNIVNNKLPKDVKLLGFILLHDKIRKEAKETLAYFRHQGVNLKIISGDNVTTVSQIAKRAGFDDDICAVDATTLDTKDKIEEAVEKYNVYGRVSPLQKKDIILALKKHGHTVAMTGDGVNDVLALKEADCSVAMASGSDAARNVSQLVLLKSNFDAMPAVVAEGRRTINNIERSASLFLVKTIYATILAVLFLFITMPYPFVPIQLSLTSVVTIGIPSFILALEPNKDRIKGDFLKNVVTKATPASLTIVSNILLIFAASTLFHLTQDQISTLSVIMTGYTGFVLLYYICCPFNRLRLLLYIAMLVLFIIGIFAIPNLFSLSKINFIMVFLLFILMYLSLYLYHLFMKFINYYLNSKTTK